MAVAKPCRLLVLGAVCLGGIPGHLRAQTGPVQTGPVQTGRVQTGSVQTGQVQAHLAAVRGKAHYGGWATNDASSHAFQPVDGWFSFGAGQGMGQRSRPATLDVDPPAEDRDGFATVAEEIVVVGERQRRDFMLVKPSDELTGPQALEAFQPYIPLPGATCAYKTLCYDLSQPPLRATLPKLLSALLGD